MLLGSSTNTALAWLARKIAYLIGRWIAGIKRGGDGAVREDSEIGQIEFRAGFGMQRDRVALPDSNPAEPAGDLFGGALILDPTVGLVVALARGLMQSGGFAIGLCRFFEDRVHGASTHAPIVDVLRCGLRWRITGLKSSKLRWRPRRSGGPGLASGSPTSSRRPSPINSPVTQADRECEQMIARHVERSVSRGRHPGRRGRARRLPQRTPMDHRSDRWNARLCAGQSTVGQSHRVGSRGRRGRRCRELADAGQTLQREPGRRSALQRRSGSVLHPKHPSRNLFSA